MKGRQRITDAYVAELRRTLTDRDLAIIETLDTVRVATAAQIERIHFTHAGNGDRQSRRRLERLTSLRLLARLGHRVGGARAGSSGYVYSLDVGGQRLAAASGPAGGSRLRRPWTPGVAFFDHALAATEGYVRLREAERAGQFELVTFEAEPRCWRRYRGIGGAACWLKPDAFVRVASGEFEYASFIEVDRGTQALTTVARKCEAYRRYWQTGREQARWGLFPKVLLLAPTEPRRAALVEVCGRQPAESWPLYQVGRVEEIDMLAAGGNA